MLIKIQDVTVTPEVVAASSDFVDAFYAQHVATYEVTSHGYTHPMGKWPALTAVLRAQGALAQDEDVHLYPDVSPGIDEVCGVIHKINDPMVELRQVYYDLPSPR